MTPSLTHKRGSGGKPDWLYRLSIYGIHSKAVKAIITEIYGKKKKSAFYEPSLTHKVGGGGGQEVNLTGYVDSLYMLSYTLSIHSNYIISITRPSASENRCKLYPP